MTTDEQHDEAQDDKPRPRIVEWLEERRETHRERHWVVRGLFIVAGFTCLVGGIVMLIAPGPAFVVIPIGLGILSLEFAWAEALLDRSLDEAAKAQKKAAETTTTERIITGIAAALAVAAVVTWGILGDIPIVPF